MQWKVGALVELTDGVLASASGGVLVFPGDGVVLIQPLPHCPTGFSSR